MLALPPSQETANPARAADFSRSPRRVVYEVTGACDLVCRQDRECPETGPHPAELTSSESRQLIDQIAEFPSPPMLVLTGGDPLKRADIFELVEHAAGSGLHVSIELSATPAATPAAIRRLADAGISRMAIGIDGADARTHDETRGARGSFDRSLEILADSRRTGVPIQVNTTLSPTNLGQIDRLAEMLAGQDIAIWSVTFPVPVSHADRAPRLSADQCEATFAQLWQHAQRQPYAVKTAEAPHYCRFVIQNQLPTTKQDADPGPRGYVPAGVNDGKETMFVNHACLVHPSGLLPIVCGVYPLEHAAWIYQRSPIFQALRDADHLQGKCRDCEFRNLCGGSRARAYAVTGNLFAQEPDCSYLPASRSPV